MNRIFKTVWNAVRRCLVVVNEAAKATSQAIKVGSIVKATSAILLSSIVAHPTYAEIILPTYVDDVKEYTYYDYCWVDDWVYSTTITETGKLVVNLTGPAGGGIWWQESDDTHIYGQFIVNGTDTLTGTAWIYMDWVYGENVIHVYDNGLFSLTHPMIETLVQNIINDAGGTISNAGTWSNTNTLGSKTTNNGLFINTGTINTNQTWAGNGQINNTGGTINITGGTFTTNTIVGGRVNLSAGNATINAFDDSTRLSMTGGTLTTGLNQIFGSVGTTGQQALNYIIGTTTSVPQSVKTLLSDYFKKYVPGYLRQNLSQIASFQNGKLIVDGSGLTITQRDDLTELFKQTFDASNVALFNHLNAPFCKLNAILPYFISA